MSAKTTIDQELIGVNKDLYLRILVLFASNDMGEIVEGKEPYFVYAALTRVIKEVYNLKEGSY